MTMTVPPESDAPVVQTVPGVELSMTLSDVNRLTSILRQFESSLHMTYSQRTEIPGITNPLHMAYNVNALCEAIEKNTREVFVAAELDSGWVRPPGGGAVYPNRTYKVRREIGQYNRHLPVAKWVWTTHSEMEMTGAEFRNYDVPRQSENELFVTRCRIHLLDEDGKILRERFGY